MDVVARLCAAARQRRSVRRFTDDRDAKIAGTFGGITADQLDAERVGNGEKTRREFAKPSLFRIGQRPRQQRVARCRAHSRQVRKIDGQRLMAETAGIGIAQKMSSFDQHVDGDHKLHSRGGLNDGCIIADADSHRVAARRATKIAVDQRELVHACVPRSRASAAISSARTSAATLSSTPFTNLCPSVPPYAFASSTASLITTR